MLKAFAIAQASVSARLNATHLPMVLRCDLKPSLPIWQVVILALTSVIAHGFRWRMLLAVQLPMAFMWRVTVQELPVRMQRKFVGHWRQLP
ncbi:hypothetical protein D9M70_651170 [compost metagenome]